MHPIVARTLSPLIHSRVAPPVVARTVSGFTELAARASHRLVDFSEKIRITGAYSTHLLDRAADSFMRLTGHRMWNVYERSPQQTKILEAVLQRVRETENAVVVLDVDDTLVSVISRKAAIFREYGRKFDVPLLTTIGPQHIKQWDLTCNLREIGMPQTWIDKNMQHLSAYWENRFLSNDYLHMDIQIPGMRKYVRDLQRAGAHIVYMTGRFDDAMRKGTEVYLEQHGFPVPDGKAATLIMKKASVQSFLGSAMTQSERIAAVRKSDAVYKEKMAESIREIGTVIAAFDNEPSNINSLFKSFSDGGKGIIVWLNTQAGKMIPLKPGIFKINGFLR